MFLRLEKHKAQPELGAISEFIAGLVAYCANDTGTVFERESFRHDYPRDEKWLLNHPTFIAAMNALYRLDAGQRRAGYAAVSHDIHFHASTLRGLDCRFAFPKLPSVIQEAVGQLYSFFYEQLRLGIKLSVVAGGSLNRDNCKEYYWEANPAGLRLCPVCLNTGNANKEHDMEHYFPKGSPFFYVLRLHPYNLYFTCKTCNVTYKCEAMPLEDALDNLQTTFLPFHAGAQEEIKLQFNKNVKDDSIQMVPSNPKTPYIKEKIHNLNRMFHLEERWTWDLEGYASALITGYSGEFSASGQENFKVDFAKKARRWERAVNANPEVTIQSAYYSWLLEEKKDSIFEAIAKKTDC